MSDTIYKYEPYQIETRDKLIKIMMDHNVAYLNGWMRCRKTSIAISVAKWLHDNGKATKVLILSTLSALNDIHKDINNYLGNTNINFTVKNYESAHKVLGVYDLIVFDECHILGYIGKTNKKITKQLKNIKSKYYLYMSGTIFLERFTTAYSLFPVCFGHYKNFYAWAKEFVDIKKKYIGQMQVNNYDEIKDKKKLLEIIEPYMVAVSQEMAGFHQKVVDKVHLLGSANINKLCKIIKKYKIYHFKQYNYSLVADSISKEFSIIKQLQSGVVKINNSVYKTLDDYKLKYIIENFKGKKICIFYNFISEYHLLNYGLTSAGYNITNDQILFNNTDEKTVFIAQFQSKREGINLSSSNNIIFMSVPFSNRSYLQARERIMSRDKKTDCTCHILCTYFDQKVYLHVRDFKGKFNAECYKKLNHDFDLI